MTVDKTGIKNKLNFTPTFWLQDY